MILIVALISVSHPCGVVHFIIYFYFDYISASLFTLHRPQGKVPTHSLPIWLLDLCLYLCFFAPTKSSSNLLKDDAHSPPTLFPAHLPLPLFMGTHKISRLINRCSTHTPPSDPESSCSSIPNIRITHTQCEPSFFVIICSR